MVSRRRRRERPYLRGRVLSMVFQRVFSFRVFSTARSPEVDARLSAHRRVQLQGGVGKQDDAGLASRARTTCEPRRGDWRPVLGITSLAQTSSCVSARSTAYLSVLLVAIARLSITAPSHRTSTSTSPTRPYPPAPPRRRHPLFPTKARLETTAVGRNSWTET
jgi:hypothetical protein